MKKSTLFISALCLSAWLSLPTKAEQVVVLTTDKAAGDTLTLLINEAVGTVTVDWGDGNVVVYTISSGSGINSLEGTVQGSTITVTASDNLNMFGCPNCSVTALDLSGATKLRSLYCQNNQLAELDIASLSKLTDLDCSGNQLASLSLSASNQPLLENINVANNELSGSFILRVASLQQIDISNNAYTTAYITNNTGLDVFKCAGNSLSRLEMVYNTAMTSLVCNDNSITRFTGIANLTALTNLVADNNSLTTLDLSSNTALDGVSVTGNNLTSITLPSNRKLTSFNCEDNYLAFYSLPYSNYTPTYFTYAPQGIITVIDGMATYFGDSIVSYMPLCPSYSTTDSEYQLDLSAYRYANNRPMVTFTWLTAEGDTLTAATASTEGDYRNNSGKFTFLTLQNDIYCQMTSSYYPDLVAVTDHFAVYDPNSSGIATLQTSAANGNNFTLSLSGNTVIMHSTNAKTISVFSISGQKVWTGTVTDKGTSVELPSGVYVANGKTFIL